MKLSRWWIGYAKVEYVRLTRNKRSGGSGMSPKTVRVQYLISRGLVGR